MIYLRARYYDSAVGAFVSEDPHWNIGNMIYGDEKKSLKSSIYFIDEGIGLDQNTSQNNSKQEKEEKIVPDINSILQSTNLYSYCMNNPVIYIDVLGEEVNVIDLGVSIGLGVYGKISLSYVYDDDGNNAILGNGGIGGGIGGSAGLSIYTYSDMDTIDDLMEGTSVSAGGGVGYISGSGEFSGQHQTASISASLPIPGIKFPIKINIGYYGTINGSFIIVRW